ncbi:ATP-grasp domain-containing protein [Streptomyces sclerotialus]|uniref:ATP-grasp domain-containing protein n=1 Tax=Streptomyces sclerotialus TaxID=1957 RepID=UPI0004C66B12
MHVLLVGPRAEVVRGLRADGHEVTLLYEVRHRDRVSDVAAMVDRTCAVDSYAKVESLWSALRHLAPRRPVEAVLTASEPAVVSAAVLGRLIGARAVAPDTALACRDKAVQKERWAAAGVPTAPWCVLPDGAGSSTEVGRSLLRAGLRFPVVVKPPADGGSKHVRLVHDLAELQEAAGTIDGGGRVLLEQYVDEPEWHFDGVVEGGEPTALMVSRYLEPLLCTKQGRPVMSLALAPSGNAVTYAGAAAFTKRVLRALGVERGVFHFEAFGRPAAFIAGELACRPGGGMIGLMGERTIGVDLWAAGARAVLGDPVPRGPVTRGVTHGFVHLPTVPGRVNRVRPEDLAGVPGVTAVMMRVPYGAVMRDMAETTSTSVAFAAVEGRSEAECRQAMDAAVSVVADIHGTAPAALSGHAH